MNKALGHFRTITKHKMLVMKYCFKIGLYRQGLLHDLSKYMWSEFGVGCKYYQGNQSPNNAERAENGCSTAWLHHKGRNKHHHEYWIDYDNREGKVIAGVMMPRRYVAEMIMDRICASKVYSGKIYQDTMPLAYYSNSKGKDWFLHDETKRQLEFLLTMLAKNGEEATLKYIRYQFLKGAPLKDGDIKESEE